MLCYERQLMDTKLEEPPEVARREAYGSPGLDPDPQTLVFTVNDAKSSDPAASGTNVNPQAKVFVRIKLRPPGKPDNLRVRAFPMGAPSLEQARTEAQAGGTGGDNQ